MSARRQRPEFFTLDELAEYLRLSERTVRDWCREGKLPSYKLGSVRRIKAEDVDRFLAQHREEAA